MSKRPIDFYFESLEKIEEDYFELKKHLPGEKSHNEYFLNEKIMDINEADINYNNLLLKSDNQLFKYDKLSKQKTGRLDEIEKISWKKDITRLTKNIRKTRDDLEISLINIATENHMYSVLKILEYHKVK